MLFPASTLAALRLDLAGRAERLRVVEADTDVAPLDLVRSGSALFAAAWIFTTPEGRTIAGLGTARRFTAHGPDRFERLAADVTAAGLPADVPLAVGFAFDADGPYTDIWDGYPSLAAVLPEIAIVDEGGRRRMIVAVPEGRDPGKVVTALGAMGASGDLTPPDPGAHTVVSEPSTTDWREEVAEAVSAIRAGTLRKVVLARSVRVDAETPPAPFDLVGHLEAQYPGCYAFGWQQGDAAFVGASPELLVGIDGTRLVSNPLAGSAPRGEGEADDRALGEGLMASDKDRSEHRLVVDDLVARLTPLVSRIEAAPTPSLRRMATVQHLSTTVRAELAVATPLPVVLDRIHPTAAVGGLPRQEALGFIDKVEHLDRGWYAGGIGWMTADQLRGEIAIGLRCGLMRRTTTRLFAGAGIVADSDPEAELVETRLKFRPLLDLLTAT